MTPTDHHIKLLLEHCKTGNQRAQMEIYKIFYKTMFNTSIRIVKDSDEAEDIMQESFLTAFNKIESLRDLSMFSAWLKRIVINNSIYVYRKNKQNQKIPLEDVLYKIENEDTALEDHDWNSIKASQILESMKSLKENYRIGLTLNLIEGYDYEEISDIMNISYANCRTLISRGKESLRKKLQGTYGLKAQKL